MKPVIGIPILVVGVASLGPLTSVAQEPSLKDALEVPAVGLSQGYLLMKNYLETYLAAAERGMTIQTPDGTIDKSNAHQYRERYEARLAVYRSAIEQRGYESFAGNYEARSTESCSRAGSAWAGTVAQGSVRGVGIEQDGFTIRLTTNFELDGELRDVEMESIAVESGMTFDDPANSEYLLVGQIADGKITVRPDDRVLDTFPGWANPPKREDLRNCVVTLQAAAVGDAVAPESEEPALAEADRHAGPWGLPDEPLLGFIEIPAGDFKMGSVEQERPQHLLTLPTYFISKYEVTVAQFAAFVEDTGYEADHVPLEAPADHPVWRVSWYDAMAYCDWLTRKLRDWTGTPSELVRYLRGQRWTVTLPSEAEWEKAARGTDARMYPWGDEDHADRGNYGRTGGPRPVGSYPAGASPYGVLDMAGNVREWTRSLWGFTYPYQPDDGREDLDAPSDTGRVVRGGSFFTPSVRFASAAHRDYLMPDAHSFHGGFRVAVSSSVPGS